MNDDVSNQMNDVSLTEFRASLLLLQFNKFMECPPPGVWILPQRNNLNHWDGVIFVRKGYWATGIFKFYILFPEEYPNKPPNISFFPPIFHPLVNIYDDSLDSSIIFKNFQSKSNHVQIVANYVYNMFNSVDKLKKNEISNEECYELYQKQHEQFVERCKFTAISSQETVFINPSNFAIPFTNESENTLRNFHDFIKNQYDNVIESGTRFELTKFFHK
eukprot:TRINITY_DN10499_c0_g1_i1.p1 TRINITY_DN10499_c0_g1~~TRINITY_DN10499_c0_g1_i1.p1  ORF type:complete len:218 (+),score=45.78 TRINITY_DN10499_c0_g1_i1:168-821(+)